MAAATGTSHGPLIDYFLMRVGRGECETQKECKTKWWFMPNLENKEAVQAKKVFDAEIRCDDIPFDDKWDCLIMESSLRALDKKIRRIDSSAIEAFEAFDLILDAIKTIKDIDEVNSVEILEAEIDELVYHYDMLETFNNVLRREKLRRQRKIAFKRHEEPED